MAASESTPAGVLIPHYRATLTAAERLSLSQCVRVLGGWPLVLVVPASVDVAPLQREWPQLQVERFDDACFRSVAAYNRLMLSDAFYARFEAYRHVLIHQLDAFVFRDALADWCARDWDYVGAPWLRATDPRNAFDAWRRRAKQYWYRRLDLRANGGVALHRAQRDEGVGNGGFSLRRVAAMRAALRARADVLPRYLDPAHDTAHEDAFFGIEVNRHRPLLRIPSLSEAVQFAWEAEPARAQRLCGGGLPFGCHAWNKLHPDFWRPLFESLGYDWLALVRE